MLSNGGEGETRSRHTSPRRQKQNMKLFCKFSPFRVQNLGFNEYGGQSLDSIFAQAHDSKNSEYSMGLKLLLARLVPPVELTQIGGSIVSQSLDWYWQSYITQESGAHSVGHGGGTCPHFYKCLVTGGTVSRTAKKKLTKLYWPSRKRSPKRLIVLLKPKSGGARPKKFFLALRAGSVPPLSLRTGAPHFHCRGKCTTPLPPQKKAISTNRTN